jgi:hypothetical protein
MTKKHLQLLVNDPNDQQHVTGGLTTNNQTISCENYENLLIFPSV